MLYIDVNKNIYPVTISDIKRNLYYISFPKNKKDFSEFGYELVTLKNNPDNLLYKETFPEKIDSGWTQSYSLKTLSAEELTSVINTKKNIKKIVINKDFEKSISHLSEKYTDAERESWTQQLEEARSYEENNLVETPLLVSISSSRNISVKDLSKRIISNSNSWKELYGKALGKKQLRMDKLEALDLTDPDILNHIENI